MTAQRRKEQAAPSVVPSRDFSCSQAGQFLYFAPAIKRHRRTYRAVARRSDRSTRQEAEQCLPDGLR